jgi:dipeptidase E
MNAFDAADPEMRRQETDRQISNLAGIGLAARELDLRANDAESLAAKFGQPDFLWVRGGNVFTLRAALARSGADALIADRLRADELVYAGFSAGACVLAPSLLGLEECDSTEDAMSMYGAVEFNGLSILDRPFVPHLRSPDHPESEALTRVAAVYAQEGKPYWGLRDGHALVVDGSSVVLLGAIRLPPTSDAPLKVPVRDGAGISVRPSGDLAKRPTCGATCGATASFLCAAFLHFLFLVFHSL